MRRIYLNLFLCLISAGIYAQDVQRIDSLKKAISLSPQDTNKVNLYSEIVWDYQWSFPDTAIAYAFRGLELSRKLEFVKGEIRLLNRMGEALSQKGNYPKALETQLKALELAETIGDSILIGYSVSFTGNVFYYSGDYQKALLYYKRQNLYNESFKFPKELVYGHLGETYFHLNQLDSALFYTQTSYNLCIKNNFLWSIPSFYLGAIYSQKDEYNLALDYYKKGVSLSKQKLDSVEGYIGLSKVFKKMNLLDSSIYYAGEALRIAHQTTLPSKLVESGGILVDIYKEKHETDSVLKYIELIMAAKDDLFAQSKQNLAFNEELHQRELTNQKTQLQNKLKTSFLYGIVILFLLIGLLLWRNNRHKQKANQLLQQQKQKVESTLLELKSTQAQLIQSEKMASLGELTAGIAHEIQNPLNFVNNFSELNEEMIDEAIGEIDKGNIDEVKNILNDIKDNSEKINHHGKRADAIVKNMLQHSKQTKGVKEPTDINTLCDEYLRLSYHGMRAKDKNSTSEFKTDFDANIGKINIVAQDIGRVLLNLINNAFYSVNERQKKANKSYQPTVIVETKKINNNVEINVKDNGNGIPTNIIDKIFQPFFTTKPTGQGTGLGLSLSYDIIKALGGEIKVETKEGEGSEFTIELPI